MFAIDQNWLPFVTSASSPGSSRFPIGRRQERRRRKREDPGDEARLSRLKKSDLPTLVYRNLNDICTCLKLRTTKTIVFLHDVIVTSMTRRNVKELGTWIVTKKQCARLWRSESVFCDPFLSSRSRHRISSIHPIFYPVLFWYPGSRGCFAGMAFSIYRFVRVASQSPSWLTTRLTSDANNFVNAKTMPEKNLYAQSMFWRTSSDIKQNNIKT